MNTLRVLVTMTFFVCFAEEMFENQISNDELVRVDEEREHVQAVIGRSSDRTRCRCRRILSPYFDLTNSSSIRFETL